MYAFQIKKNNLIQLNYLQTIMLFFKVVYLKEKKIMHITVN